MGAARAEVPGPKGFWPVGHVVQFRRDPLAFRKPWGLLTPVSSTTAAPVHIGQAHGAVTGV